MAGLELPSQIHLQPCSLMKPNPEWMIVTSFIHLISLITLLLSCLFQTCYLIIAAVFVVTNIFLMLLLLLRVTIKNANGCRFLVINSCGIYTFELTRNDEE